jgi:hypothetical protein
MKKDFSRDFRDIAYFIEHVQHLDARVDVLKKLGYKIGVDIVKKGSEVGNVIVGKKGELRVQITPPDDCWPLAKCVILE